MSWWASILSSHCAFRQAPNLYSGCSVALSRVTDNQEGGCDVSSLSLSLHPSLLAVVLHWVLIYEPPGTLCTGHSPGLYLSCQCQGQEPDGLWCPGPGSLVSIDPEWLTQLRNSAARNLLPKEAPHVLRGQKEPEIGNAQRQDRGCSETTQGMMGKVAGHRVWIAFNKSHPG